MLINDLLKKYDMLKNFKLIKDNEKYYLKVDKHTKREITYLEYSKLLRLWKC